MSKQREAEFFRDLRALLDEYDADILAVDDGRPYGMAQPLIEVQFNDPYAVYRYDQITAIDDPEVDEQAKQG